MAISLDHFPERINWLYKLWDDHHVDPTLNDALATYWALLLAAQAESRDTSVYDKVKQVSSRFLGRSTTREAAFRRLHTRFVQSWGILFRGAYADSTADQIEDIVAMGTDKHSRALMFLALVIAAMPPPSSFKGGKLEYTKACDELQDRMITWSYIACYGYENDDRKTINARMSSQEYRSIVPSTWLRMSDIT